jgi:hypothetical protein
MGRKDNSVGRRLSRFILVISAVRIRICLWSKESVRLHLTLGNPSGVTTSTQNKNNYLLVKPQFAIGRE